MAVPTWGPRLEGLQAEAHAMLGQEAPPEAIADRMDDLGASWEDMLRICLLGRWPEWQPAPEGWRLLLAWLRPRYPLWEQALARAAAAPGSLHRCAAERLPASEAGLAKMPWIVAAATPFKPGGGKLPMAPSRPGRIDGVPLFAPEGSVLIVQGARNPIPGPCWAKPVDRDEGGLGWLVVRDGPATRLEEDVRVEGAGEGLVLRLPVLDGWKPFPAGVFLEQRSSRPGGVLCREDEPAEIGVLAARKALALEAQGHAVLARPLPLFRAGDPVWVGEGGTIAPVPARPGEEPAGFVDGVHEPGESRAAILLHQPWRRGPRERVVVEIGPRWR